MTANTPAPEHKRRYRRRTCRYCSAAGSPDNPISARGLCGPCCDARVAEAVRAMHDKSGPVHQRWARGMLEAAMKTTGGRVLVVLDNETPEDQSTSAIDARRLA